MDAGKSEIKALADLASEGPPSESQLLVFSVCLHAVEMIGGFSWTSLVRAMSPLMVSPPPKAPPPAAIRLGSGIAIYNFSGEATIHSLYDPPIYIYLSVCLSVCHTFISVI